MALAIMFIGAPLVIYLFLVAIPAGRGSMIIIGGVGLIIAYIWVGYLLSWDPLWTGNDRADAYTFAAATISTIAFLAGSVTAVFGRKLAAQYASLPYPAVVVLILLITMVPLFLVVGL
jgi:cytochrome bd-type quinol oxidase subunit 1